MRIIENKKLMLNIF